MKQAFKQRLGADPRRSKSWLDHRRRCMTAWLALACLIFLVANTSPVHAQQSSVQDMAIVTGSERGTYFAFGRDLRRAVERFNIRLDVRKSKGSIDNMQRLRTERGVQLAIVQSDVLGFVREFGDVANNPDLRNYLRDLRVVAPLYNEEIHLVSASEKIRSFDDLPRARVAVGRDGSGTYLTTRFVFELTGVWPREERLVNADEALQLMRDGKLDAMFYVIGSPAPLLREKIQPFDNFNLVPIDHERLYRDYERVVIPADTYSWLNRDVPTIGVRSVLMSYDYENTHCRTVGKVGRILHDNLGWLRQHGHSKWKNVDLDARLPDGWRQYQCVVEALLAEAKGYPIRGPVGAVSFDNRNSCSAICTKGSVDYNPISCVLCTRKQY